VQRHCADLCILRCRHRHNRSAFSTSVLASQQT
jgi:hypothetical protein